VENNQLIKETFKKFNEDLKKLNDENINLKKENEGIKEQMKKASEEKPNNNENERKTEPGPGSNDDIKQQLKESLQKFEDSELYLQGKVEKLNLNVSTLMKRIIVDEFIKSVLKKEESIDLQREDKIHELFDVKNGELFLHFNDYLNKCFENDVEKAKFRSNAERQFPLMLSTNLKPHLTSEYEEDEKEFYSFMLRYSMS